MGLWVVAGWDGGQALLHSMRDVGLVEQEVRLTCLRLVGWGQPSGVTINSLEVEHGPRQPCFYGVPFPGSCDLTVYKWSKKPTFSKAQGKPVFTPTPPLAPSLDISCGLCALGGISSASLPACQPPSSFSQNGMRRLAFEPDGLGPTLQEV